MMGSIYVSFVVYNKTLKWRNSGNIMIDLYFNFKNIFDLHRKHILLFQISFLVRIPLLQFRVDKWVLENQVLNVNYVIRIYMLILNFNHIEGTSWRMFTGMDDSITIWLFLFTWVNHQINIDMPYCTWSLVGAFTWVKPNIYNW